MKRSPLPQTHSGFSRLAAGLTLIAICVGSAMLSANVFANSIQDDPKPETKFTIKQIMDLAHKKGLTKKVATGKATAIETKQLHTLYKAMSKLSPPQGDKKSWDAKTKALVEAAKAAVDKKVDYKTKLKTASNCAACHKIHKP